MRVTTAIENILKETMPDTINGIHIKYDLREVQSLVYYDQKDYILTLMPIGIECENVAVSLRISPYTFPLDINETSLAYGCLQKQVEEMLMTYIRNIKNWHSGKILMSQIPDEAYSFTNCYKIPDKTPVCCDGNVIGSTIGENAWNKPVKMVLYPQCFSVAVNSNSYQKGIIDIDELRLHFNNTEMNNDII